MRKLFINDKFMFLGKNTYLKTIMIIMILISIFSIIIAFIINPILAIVLFLLFFTFFLVNYYLIDRLIKSTNDYVSNLLYRAKIGEQEAIIRMPVGVILYDKDMNIQWVNPFIYGIFPNENLIGENIYDIFPNMKLILKDHEKENNIFSNINYKDRYFDVYVQKSINVFYFIDTTKYIKLQNKYDEDQIVIGQLFLDNYDEVTQTMDDQSISNLNNYVTNLLSDWATEFHLFLKRVDDDHFFIIGYMHSLVELEKNKFAILDTLRESTSKQNYPITLSVGISYGYHSLSQLANDSQECLDLALGRGGDQVVVKNNNEPARFYGGKTDPMEKRTRVRARMVSQALQDLFTQVDQIFVMGHKHPDMDTLGSSLGIRRIAQMNDKKCWIVVEDDRSHIHTDVKRLLLDVKQYSDDESSIITSSEAMNIATLNSLLIMVDHSKPSISISQDLYNKLTNRTVIIDHHRRGEEFPKNPMLVYIEPYASSTCELITEMFEYQPKNSKPINKIEATAMLAGITVDTHSFSLRTGTRTFDAASYLRSVGADATVVQDLLKENVNNYLEKNHLIDTIKMIEPNIALCVGEENKKYDPVIAAQAADTLLSLSNIDASYVIIRRSDNNVGISARSLGNINVQLIMEKMGGGGHFSEAATQILDKSVNDVKNELISIIHEQYNDSISKK